MAKKPDSPGKTGGDGKAASSNQKWLTLISSYETEFKNWEKRAEKITKIYRDHDQQSDTRNNGATNFNILWSNVQTCLPATFARLPKPDVSRRFRDNDPVGRVAALMLERALEFEIEHYPDYRAAMENSVLDRFLGGRGVAWIRYEPHFKAAEQGMPQDGVQVTEDADESEETPAAQEEIDYECAPVDYVHWKDFGHSVARTWEEVQTVWRRVYMLRPALVERFGEELGEKIPLDTRPDDQKKSVNTENSQACVYEIWDKATNKAYWLSKGMPDLLDERDDPLGLECFFPCPRPLFATLTTDSLIPVPDFKLYQDQANELNVLADRIDRLIKALKVRGVYDASQPEIGRLFTEAENNTLIPVKNWQAFAEKQGLSGSIDIVDLTPIASTLNEAYKAVDAVKNEIYEIMGIADILRGSTDPGETLGAQKLKGQFGGMRLRAMQGKVGQFATEILQIKAQVICKLFQPETIMAISGANQLSPADAQLVPQALQLLLGNRAMDSQADSDSAPLRDFRIDVSADSMVQMDEQQEKQDRMEFLKATGAFLEQALPLAQESPQIAPLLLEMMKFGVTGFRVGKSIEGQFDQTLDQLKQDAANPPAKPPTKEQLKAQNDAQTLQLKAQLEQSAQQQSLAIDQQRMAMESHFEQIRQQNEMAVQAHAQQVQNQQTEHQNQMEAQRQQMEAASEERLERMRMMHEAALEQSRQQFDLLIARLGNAAKVDVAEVAAGAVIQRAEISAANSAAKDDSIEGVQDGQPALAQPTPQQ